MGGRPNLPATSVSLCISSWSAAGSGSQHSPSPHVPHTFLEHVSKFLWSPIRPANPSCVLCFPVPFARVSGVERLDCPAIPAVQPSASRYRCFTSPPQAPCPVNLGSIRASGGTWRPYPRRCGDQADPPMMVATLAQIYTQSQCILIASPRHHPMCCNAPNMMIHCGVRPPLRTAPSKLSTLQVQKFT